MPVASAQVKSADPARRAVCERHDVGHRTCAHARSHRAHAARLRVDSRSTRGRGRARAVGRNSPAPASTCRVISPRRRSSWSPADRPGPARCSTIENVGINPTRTGVIDILRLMGADLRIVHRAHRGRRAGGGHRGAARRRCAASACREALVPLAIDELPVLFIAAAARQGETVVTGAEELRVKESDRTRRDGRRTGTRMGVAVRAGAGWHSHRGRTPLLGWHGRQPRRSSHRHGVCRWRASSATGRSGCGTC